MAQQLAGEAEVVGPAIEVTDVREAVAAGRYRDFEEYAAPRTKDGHPDLSGLWNPHSNKYLRNIAADLKAEDVPFQPWLRGRPIVVLSNNDGCAVSRSREYEADASGARLCHRASGLEHALAKLDDLRAARIGRRAHEARGRGRRAFPGPRGSLRARPVDGGPRR